MTVKDQILEILEIQSRLTSLGNETQAHDINVANADRNVKKVMQGKDEFLTFKKMAQEKLDDSMRQVNSCKSALEQAKINLAQSEKKVEVDKSALDEFSDAVLDQHIISITKANAELDKAALARQNLLKEIEANKANIEKIQISLREKGYDFSFTSDRAPRTAYL